MYKLLEMEFKVKYLIRRSVVFEEKERFKNILVDYTSEKNFDARIVLKESPAPDDKKINLLSMELYFSPAEDMHVYLKNMMFGGQETETKGVAVDTAQYRIEVDEKYLNVHIGEDGWCCSLQLRAYLDEIPKDRPVYLHCKADQTSYNAVLALQGRFFRKRS